jgi:hypothetical protein
MRPTGNLGEEVYAIPLCLTSFRRKHTGKRRILASMSKTAAKTPVQSTGAATTGVSSR